MARPLNVQITGDNRDLHRAFEKSGSDAERFARRVEKSNRQVHDSSRDAHAGVEQLAHTMRKMFDMSAKIGAVGLAAQGISALGAGGAAAAAGLAPLSGLLATYPALASTAAQGMGVFKLATNNVFEAVGGLNERLDKNTKQFKALTPEAKRLAEQLDRMKKPIRDLSTTAQHGLFPGLLDGIQSAKRNLPVVTGIVSDTAHAFGDFGRQVGTVVGSKAFGRDLALQGERNVRWMRQFGSIAINLGKALEDVTITAGPLTGWLVRMAAHGAEVTQRFAHAGRQSGALAGFFDQTRLQASRLIRIAGDLGGALLNIGKAAYPLGNDLLRSLTRTVDKFREWTDSARGQNAIRQYFEQARPAIYEAAKLVRDIGGAFLRLGSGDQVAPLLRTVRTELVPAFEGMFQSTTREFMPAFLGFATEAIKLFTHLAGTSGPLVELTKLLGRAAGALNTMLDTFPGLNTAVVSLLALGGIAKALRLAGAITGVSTLLGLLRKTRTAAAEVGAVSAISGGVGGTAGGRAGRAAGRIADNLPIVGAGLIAGATAVSAVKASGDAKSLEAFNKQLSRLVATRNLDGLQKLRDEFERFHSFPGGIDAANAALKRAQNQIKDLSRQNLHKWQQDIRDSFNGVARTGKNAMEATRNAVRSNLKIIKDRLGKDTDEGRAAAATNFRGAARAIREAMQSGMIDTRKGTREIRRYLIDGLTGLGLTRQQATAKLDTGTIQTRRGPQAGAARGGRVGSDGRIHRDGGGWVGAPGMVGMDSVPAMLAPGEAVLNRHQQAVVEGMLGDGFLERLFANVNRPHFMARGGIVPVPGFPGERAASSVIPMIEMIARRFGLILTDAFGPGHKSPGHTRFGTAADFAGPDRSMDRAVRFLVGRGFLVGYDGRFGSQAWPGHGPTSVAGGNAHLHVELGGGGGALATDVKIPRMVTGLRGGLGAIVQRGLDRARSGAHDVARSKLEALVSMPTAGGGGGGMSKAQIAQLWVRAGGDPGRANLMAAIALAESGGRSGIVNSIGATGLWQIHPGGSQYLNPLANARAAIGKLRTQGLGAWEAYTNGSYRQYMNRGGYARGRSAQTRGYARGGAAVYRWPSESVARHSRPFHGGHNQSASTHGGGGGGGGAQPVALVGPGYGGYEQKLDDASLAEATARSKNNLAGLIKALQSEIALKRGRLKKVRKALRRRLRPDTRKRLTEEAATLMDDIGTLRETLTEFRADAKGGAKTISRAEVLEHGRDPDLPEKGSFRPGGTMAGVEADTGGDTTGGDTGGTGEDPNAALIASQQALQAAIEQHAATEQSLRDEFKRANDIADQAGQSELAQMKKWLADVTAGQVAGRTRSRGFTPGNGVALVY